MTPQPVPVQSFHSSSHLASGQLASLTPHSDRAIALTAYRSQGFGHILKLSGIVTAGTLLVSAGGSLLFAAPLALATLYSLFRTTGKIRSRDWCESRDEIFEYRLSAHHRSLLDDYPTWCQQWSTKTINDLIEPMIGYCVLANFVKDKNHPYYGLRHVLVYDHDEDDLPPLTPHDYITARLQQRLDVFARQQSIQTVDAQANDVQDSSQSESEPNPPLTLDELAQNPKPLSDSKPSQTIITDQTQICQFLESLTASPMQPTLIAGLPGMGKGVATAIALQVGKKLHHLRYWVFDAKSKLEEACYWTGAERHYLKNILMPDPDLFTDLMTVLDEFAAIATERNNDPAMDTTPMVLLIEEINGIIGQFSCRQKEQFKTRIIALAALLRGCTMAIWLSGQSVTLEDLGLKGKSNRNMFNAIVAASGDKGNDTRPLAQLLGIEVDVSLLQSGDRYWLTNRGLYQVPSLNLEQVFPVVTTWSRPNVMDLRPTTSRGAQPASNPASPLESLDKPFPAQPTPKPSRKPPRILIRSSPYCTPESGSDPALVLILEEPDGEKRNALLIAYRWAKTRLEKGEAVTRETFRNRATSERKSVYLKENYSQIWDDLEGLIF